MRQVAALPGDRVVVDGLPTQMGFLAPGFSSSEFEHVRGDEVGLLGHAEQSMRQPGCEWSGAQRAGPVLLGGSRYLKRGAIDSCYDGVVLRYRQGGRTIALVGDRGFMSNEGIAAPGAAALALNLLGTQHTVVWLVLDPSQQPEHGPEAQPGLLGLVPDRVWWAAGALASAVALAGLWQGRRLGPVVVERLPVVVRASETAEGLGRLYRSRRARDRAAAALREAAAARLSKRLGIPARSRKTLAGALTARSALGQDAIESIVYGPDPGKDSELVALAEKLDRLEGQVRQV